MSEEPAEPILHHSSNEEPPVYVGPEDNAPLMLIPKDSLPPPDTEPFQLDGYASDAARRLIETRRSFERELSARVEHEESAKTDFLTGLLNRRGFIEAVTSALEAHQTPDLERREERADKTILGIIDLDNFKQFNDTQGHDEGDELLKRFSATVRQLLRVEDQIARFGGDEFAILLPNTDPEDAKEVMERIQKAISTSRYPIGTSIGLTTLDASVVDSLRKADKAMYKAKLDGKNKTIIYDESLAETDATSAKNDHENPPES